MGAVAWLRGFAFSSRTVLYSGLYGKPSLDASLSCRVDMTIDGAVRVTNAKNNIILALSRSGAAAALIHPNGRVYHYGSRVEIQARHQQGNNK